jgi:hypothetical protein
MTAVVEQPATASTPSLEIAERTRIHGPLTRRALRRTTVGVALLWAAALTPIVFAWAPRWKAAGLGLLFPGAGFLYTSDPVLFVLTLLVLPFVVLHFQFRADNVTPAVFLVGTAAAASFRTHTGLWDWALWVVPVALAVSVVAFKVARRRSFARAQARRVARTERLVDRVWAPPRAVAVPVTELSAEDLAMQRAILDRALQPLDEWEGFDWVQQYSMAAMRYQLCWLQWSLATSQYSHSPAFVGFASEAQRNLIEKMTDRRVWEYWHRENLWGNLDLNPDPIRRDNIMLSGYYALMLGAYASTTGDRRYDEAGCLPFRWDEKRTFAYDHPAVVDAIVRNHTNAWSLFPCEPGLNFAGCNVISMLGVVLRDKVDGTDRAAGLLPRFRQSLDEEYTTADGEIVTIISRRYGYSMRFARSVVGQAGTAFLVRPLAPDVAARLWEVFRDEVIGVDHGRFTFTSFGTERLDKIDLGNNAKSPVTVLAFLSALAREMGDEEAYKAMEAAADEALDPRVRDGARWYAGASTIGNAMLALGRLGRADGWHDLVARGAPDAWHRGPRLVEVAYPDVLVARAASDGRALELVLHPGAGEGRQRLRVERLDPGRAYRVRGGGPDHDAVGGADGGASFAVDLGGRTEVALVPAS